MKIKAVFIGDRVTSNDVEAHNLFSSQRFGEKIGEKIFYSLQEAFYLVQEGKIEVFDYKNKKISEKELLIRFVRIDKKFKTKFFVFQDLRRKGYIVKAGLKFGAEFRVYDRGKKVDEEHSKWILFPFSENQKMTWQDFSAKNRVAHSTKKNLLIAIVDEEGDVLYYEIKWIQP